MPIPLDEFDYSSLMLVFPKRELRFGAGGKQFEELLIKPLFLCSVHCASDESEPKEIRQNYHRTLYQ